MGIFDEMYGEDWTLEKALEDDAGGAKKQAVLQALEQKKAELKRKLDQGVTPDDFKKGETLLLGYDAAIAGVEMVWKKMYQDNS